MGKGGNELDPYISALLETWDNDEKGVMMNVEKWWRMCAVGYAGCNKLDPYTVVLSRGSDVGNRV